MAKDPAFLFYPGDYLRDTQCLSENVQVAYDRIMCEHMRNICLTQQQLNFFTKRLTVEEKEELKMVLEENDGCFFIPWVAESITKRKAYSESRRNNRKGKTKKDVINTCKTYDKHMEDENENENINTVKEESEKTAKPELYPFETWWNIYDKKIDREKSETKWNRLTDTERKAAIIHTPKYIESQPDKSFRRHPTTYLNNKSWENEIIKSNNNVRSNGAPNGSGIPGPKIARMDIEDARAIEERIRRKMEV